FATVLSYGAHRFLHSFPTRRSSDLSTVKVLSELVTFLKVSPAVFGLAAAVCAEARPVKPYPIANTPVNATAASTVGFETVNFNLDRKSTRLNSSHGSNSYAVFCFKK